VFKNRTLGLTMADTTSKRQHNWKRCGMTNGVHSKSLQLLHVISLTYIIRSLEARFALSTSLRFSEKLWARFFFATLC